MKHLTIFALAILVFISCNKTEKTDQIVDPPANIKISDADLAATVNMNKELSEMNYSLDSLMAAAHPPQQLHWDSLYHHHDSLFWHHHNLYHHETYAHDDHHHTWIHHDSTINHPHHHPYPGHLHDSLVTTPNNHHHNNNDNHHTGHHVQHHTTLDSLHQLHNVHHP